MLGLGMGLNKAGRKVSPKNEVVYTPSTWAEWELFGNSVIEDDCLKIVRDAQGGGEILASLDCNFKPSTQYGLLLYAVAATAQLAAPPGGAFATDAVLAQSGTNAYIKNIVTTLAEITANKLALKSFATNSYYKFKDIRIFELPIGSQIEAYFANLTADQLNAKYPF